MSCSSCGHGIIRDDVTGNRSCGSCGTLQEYDSYEGHAFCMQGPVGVKVHVGTTGTGDSLAYREKKIFEANNLINDITNSLDLSDTTVHEIKSMIDEITEGEFGKGEWFKVLIGACAYAYMRSRNKAISISQVGQAVECDVYELGRMVKRVVEHLELSLPEFDIANAFQKVVANFANLGRIDGDMVERIKKQGVFFIQCAIKWFLTTGRRPMPVVAAVFALVAKLNGIQDVRIDDVANYLLASVVTSQRRYKELLEKLVEVAQALPWGKNVTVKNVIESAPPIIRYMELKSSAKRGKGSENFDSAVFDIGEILSQCLSNQFSDGVEDDDDDDRRGIVEMGHEDVDNLHLSHEGLSMAYEKFLVEGNGRMSAEETGGVAELPSQGEYSGGIGVLYASEWWNGKSPLSKKLVLKDILENDVGLDALPPSFVKGCADIKRRRAKIKAAKERLERNELPSNGDEASTARDIELVDAAYSKKRKRKEENIDWEDLIIEALIVHQVKEEEIEKGYYKALLGLHVFNSGIDVKEKATT